jgi:CheY-like chemotaxis protein
MARTTILVVEGNTVQRAGLVVVLRQHGFQVAAAADGKDAWNRLNSGRVPNLILLDMHLPSSAGDGWWFLQQRTHRPSLATIPVVLSTMPPMASRELATMLGVQGLVSKPFEVKPLVAEIRRCVRRQVRRARDEPVSDEG